MRPSRIMRIAVLMLLSSSAANAELVPAGNEFQTNSYTVGQQVGAKVAPTADGGFVAVWTNLAPVDGSGNGVFGQRFTSAAVRIGSEFQINTFTVDGQGGSSVGSDAQGRFVVTWDSYYQDGSSYEGVFGQRFDSSGQPAGTEFQINTYTLGSQENAQVAVEAGGNFVIVWDSYDELAGQDGSYAGIFARRFDSTGSAVGTEFLVNTYTEESQFAPAVAKAADGSFLVVWYGAGPGGGGVWGRLFDSLGQPAGPQSELNESLGTGVRDPDVDALAGGGFIVAWARDIVSFEEDIHARRFDASAAPLGAEFRVNTFTSQRQIAASVAATADGGFAIAWQSTGEDGSSNAVMVRHYDESGVPYGEPTRMNITTANSQGGPALTETTAGNLVGLWTSNLQDGSFEGIFGVRLVPFGNPLSAKKLLIKNPAAGPTKNKLVFLSKDTSVAAPATIGEDPRCAPIGSGTAQAGATLQVTGLGGDFAIDLPCVGWTANASETKYSYKDATGATCSKVTVQAGRQIKAVCKGSQVAYTLGAAQGDVSVVLEMGEDLEYCAAFGPSTSADVKRDGSNGRTYKALDSGPPAICP